VRELMSYWIIPDFIVLRADYEITKELCEKVASFCDIHKDYVIPAMTAKSIYEVPLNFNEHNLWNLILKKFHMQDRTFDLSKWQELMINITKSHEVINIAMVWKYNDLEDAYYSLNEWLRTAWYYHNKKVNLVFVDATEIEKSGVEILNNMDWICIPWWFWDRWIEWMVLACNYARTKKIPYLWICLWSQIMAIEFARNVLNITKANSEEFLQDWDHNVVHIMEDQKNIDKKWWTMRLWSYECLVKSWTLAYDIYKEEIITERHRHRFEFNNKYRDDMLKNGFIVSGTSLDWNLVEIVEVADHPFMIGTQAHPELKSRPTNPHKLFLKFVESMCK
jgi:CTP synthase